MPFKYFISYKYTNRNINTLHNEIDPIMKTIQNTGSTVFCNLYSDDMYLQNNYSTKQIMQHCFDNLKLCDVYIAYIAKDSDEFGGGMAIECGYAIHQNMPIVSCIPVNCTHKYKSLVGLCSNIIEYCTIEDLCNKLKAFINTQ